MRRLSSISDCGSTPVTVALCFSARGEKTLLAVGVAQICERVWYELLEELDPVELPVKADQIICLRQRCVFNTQRLGRCFFLFPLFALAIDYATCRNFISEFTHLCACCLPYNLAALWVHVEHVMSARATGQPRGREATTVRPAALRNPDPLLLPSRMRLLSLISLVAIDR